MLYSNANKHMNCNLKYTEYIHWLDMVTIQSNIHLFSFLNWKLMGQDSLNILQICEFKVDMIHFSTLPATVSASVARYYTSFLWKWNKLEGLYFFVLHRYVYISGYDIVYGKF